MFLLESSLTGAATIITDKILVTNAETIAYGEALVATGGRLTKCGATVAPQFISAQAIAGGTDKTIDYIPVRRDQTFVADITGGTAAALAAVVGSKTVQLDATGLNVNVASLTGGNVEIVSVDTVKNKARVRFNL
jgi:hypothetical protein